MANEKTLAPAVNVDVVRNHILPILSKLVVDRIPNIKFNVAKAYEALSGVLKQSPEGRELIEQQVKPYLDTLSNDDDSDVQYFSNKAIMAL